jgi:hypothetical protein
VVRLPRARQILLRFFDGTIKNHLLASSLFTFTTNDTYWNILLFSQIKMTMNNLSLLLLAFFGIIAIVSASTSGLRGAAAAGDIVEEEYDHEDFQGEEVVLTEDYYIEDIVDEEDRMLYVQPQNTQHYRYNGNHGGNNNWNGNRQYNNNRYYGNNHGGNNNNYYYNNNWNGNNQYYNNNRYNYNNIFDIHRNNDDDRNDDDFDLCNFAYGCYVDGGLQNYYYGGGYGRGYHGGRKGGYGGGYRGGW